MLDVARQLTQRLGHQAGLETNMAVPHLTFNFGLGRQRCHGVHDDDVNSVGAYQHVRDFQRLLTGVRLGYQEFIHVHAQLFGIDRVQGMLRIHKRTGFSSLLGLGNHLQGQRGFTRAFRAVDLTDTTIRQTAYSQRHIQAQGTGGYRRDRFPGLVAHLHDSALAELAFDLAQCCAQCFLAVVFHRCKPSVANAVIGTGARRPKSWTAEPGKPDSCIFEQY